MGGRGIRSLLVFREEGGGGEMGRGWIGGRKGVLGVDLGAASGVGYTLSYFPFFCLFVRGKPAGYCYGGSAREREIKVYDCLR